MTPKEIIAVLTEAEEFLGEDFSSLKNMDLTAPSRQDKKMEKTQEPLPKSQKWRPRGIGLDKRVTQNRKLVRPLRENLIR